MHAKYDSRQSIRVSKQHRSLTVSGKAGRQSDCNAKPTLTKT